MINSCKMWKKVISASLIMILVIAYIPSMVFAEGDNVVDRLIDFDISASQNGVEILEGGTMTNTDPVTINGSFRVPVAGDSPTPADPVQHDDFAEFQIAAGFNLVDSPVTLELTYAGVAIGTLTITSEDGIVTGRIDFDGESEVFSGEYSDIRCEFSSTLNYDNSGDGGNEGNHIVTILEKEYTVNVPVIPVEYDGNKTGVRDGKYINWAVRVQATKGSDDFNIDGLKFSDDITDVGTYVPGTFKIGSSSDVNNAEAVNPDFTEAATLLEYTFPDNTTGTRYVFFRTEIPDSKFYATSAQTIENTAYLKDGEEVKLTKTGTVSYSPTWIEKKELGHDNSTGTISWTITANQLEASLTNAVITDGLDSKLIYDSATLKKWDKAANEGQGAWVDAAFTKDGNDFLLGDINTKVLLTINAHIDTAVYNIGHKIQKVTNKATLKWDGESGVNSNTVNTNIGFNPMSKDGVSGSTDKTNHTVEWKVTAKASDMNNDLRVIDFLVYGSEFDVNGSYTLSGENSGGLTEISTEIIPKLTPRYHQRYYEGSFVGDGMKLTKYQVMDSNNKAVADLLVITADDNNGLKVNEGDQIFNFKSQITNPLYYASNSEHDILNYATLFSASTMVNGDSASIKYKSAMLQKDMFKAENTGDIESNKDSAAASVAEGFNYEDKDIVFRLYVNANQLVNLTDDITPVAGEVVGNVTLKDSLPDGWEFKDIDEGKKFLIYKGENPNNGKLTPTNLITDTSFMMANFDTDGEAIFTFTQMEDSYVIFVKAGPKAGTLSDYFSTNQTTDVTNNALLSSNEYNSLATGRQDIRIVSEILKKIANLEEAGVVKWTVEYKPYDLEHEGIEIEDTMSEGIDLRVDSSGNLDLTNNNIVMRQLSLNADGTYSDGELIPLEEGRNVFYDNNTRTLKFEILDTSKAYRFEYITDITGKAGTTINNQVKLINSDFESVETYDNYVVTRSDTSATMTRNAWIKINKVDNLNDPVEGVEFTLYAQDEETIIRTGETDSLGELYLLSLPEGNYILKETNVPEGYEGTLREFAVSVVKIGDAFEASIDEQTGEGANEITIENRKLGLVGDLEIVKNLRGNANETEKEFNFTIQVEGLSGDYSYKGSGGKDDGIITFTDGEANIALKGGESIIIEDLPKELGYTVTEDDYSDEYYMSSYENATGTIIVDEKVTAIFTNTKDLGNLKIEKLLTGNAYDPGKDFDFNIRLIGFNGTVDYIGSGGKENGTITFVNGEAEVSLKGGQSIIIESIPKNIIYEVMEADYSELGYEVSIVGNRGIILSDRLNVVSFTNDRTINTYSSHNVNMPKTDDNSNLLLYVSMLVFSIVAAILIFIIRKREQDR